MCGASAPGSAGELGRLEVLEERFLSLLAGLHRQVGCDRQEADRLADLVAERLESRCGAQEQQHQRLERRLSDLASRLQGAEDEQQAQGRRLGAVGETVKDLQEAKGQVELEHSRRIQDLQHDLQELSRRQLQRLRPLEERLSSLEGDRSRGCPCAAAANELGGETPGECAANSASAVAAKALDVVRNLETGLLEELRVVHDRCDNLQGFLDERVLEPLWKLERRVAERPVPAPLTLLSPDGDGFGGEGDVWGAAAGGEVVARRFEELEQQVRDHSALTALLRDSFLATQQSLVEVKRSIDLALAERRSPPGSQSCSQSQSGLSCGSPPFVMMVPHQSSASGSPTLEEGALEDRGGFQSVGSTQSGEAHGAVALHASAVVKTQGREIESLRDRLEALAAQVERLCTHAAPLEGRLAAMERGLAPASPPSAAAWAEAPLALQAELWREHEDTAGGRGALARADEMLEIVGEVIHRQQRELAALAAGLGLESASLAPEGAAAARRGTLADRGPASAPAGRGDGDVDEEDQQDEVSEREEGPWPALAHLSAALSSFDAALQRSSGGRGGRRTAAAGPGRRPAGQRTSGQEHLEEEEEDEADDHDSEVENAAQDEVRLCQENSP